MDKGSQRRIATAIAACMFLFYAAWNMWWLSLLQVPPSLLVSATGIPAPTTGGTRSMCALLDGNVPLSLYHNPATLPILFLLCLTVFHVLRKGSAPRWIYTAWCRLLVAAFGAKVALALVLG